MSEMTEAKPSEAKFQLCLTLLVVLAAYCALDGLVFDKRLMDSRLELQEEQLEERFEAKLAVYRDQVARLEAGLADESMRRIYDLQSRASEQERLRLEAMFARDKAKAAEQEARAAGAKQKVRADELAKAEAQASAALVTLRTRFDEIKASGDEILARATGQRERMAELLLDLAERLGKVQRAADKGVPRETIEGLQRVARRAHDHAERLGKER
jgi:hypothetical protein